MAHNKFSGYDLKLLSIAIEAADIYEHQFLKDMILTHVDLDVDNTDTLSNEQVERLKTFEKNNYDLLVSIIVSNKRRGLFYLLTYFSSRISFNRVLGMLIIAFGCSYISYVTVTPLPENNIRFVDTVLGFVLGTMLSTVINFYFGSSNAPHAKLRKNENKDSS